MTPPQPQHDSFRPRHGCLTCWQSRRITTDPVFVLSSESRVRARARRLRFRRCKDSTAQEERPAPSATFHRPPGDNDVPPTRPRATLRTLVLPEVRPTQAAPLQLPKLGGRRSLRRDAAYSSPCRDTRRLVIFINFSFRDCYKNSRFYPSFLTFIVE